MAGTTRPASAPVFRHAGNHHSPTPTFLYGGAGIGTGAVGATDYPRGSDFPGHQFGSPVPTTNRRKRPFQAVDSQTSDGHQRSSNDTSGNHFHIASDSVTTSHYSTCCSSCSEGIPCAAPDCENQREVVIQCDLGSCDQSICSGECLSVGLQEQQEAMEATSAPADSVSDWEYSVWNPEARSPQPTNHPSQSSLLDPNLSFDNFTGIHNIVPDTMTSGTPATTSPSTALYNSTSFSQESSLPPQYGEQASPSSHIEDFATMLSGAGTRFSDTILSESQGHLYGHPSQAHNQTMNCAWNHCGQEFNNEYDWYRHFHQNHIDPQMTFICPITGHCSGIIGSHPVDHLVEDHGWDLDSSSYLCPDPVCLGRNETFCNPDMLHNHFDESHSKPAQGELHCEWDTCGVAVSDPIQLIAHLNEQHKVNIPTVIEEEINLSMPLFDSPSNVSNSLSELSVPETKPKLTTVSPDPGEDDGTVLRCQWKMKSGDICGELAVSEAALHNHVKIHLAELSKQTGYICQWKGCSRDEKRGAEQGFTQRGKLERHMATHTGFKSCRCDECGQLFSAPQALKQHVLLHTGEKPWGCRFCDKKFPQQSAATIHERTHTKEKPLECETCGRRFSESSNLAKHRKIHGDKGRHVCRVEGCKKAFVRLDQLKRHVASTHPEVAAKNAVERANAYKQPTLSESPSI
ncbi:hypothetical protein F5884DRAFT_677112 [Xylogone sp. PMI_703]|nr:hypothetical protein F5884DRAFT_677112 [Xylogone sp. PMI_703]